MNFTKTTKILLAVLLMIILGGGALYLYKNKNGNPVSDLKPKVEMGIGRISNITDSTIDLSLNLLIHNPLPIGLDIKALDYFVTMNGVTVVENNYEKPVLLKANDSSLVSLPTQLKIADLSKEGSKESKKGEDSADYHFETTLHLNKSFLGKDSLTLSMDKRLPLYQMPKVQIVDFDMEKFRLSKSDVVVKLKFSNRNSFPIEFKNPRYVIDLGKQKRLAEGQVNGVTKVNGKSSEIYEIPLAINMGKILKATGQIIAKGKELPFTLYFKSKLVSENEVFKDSDVNIIVDGELRDVGTMKKNLGN